MIRVSLLMEQHLGHRTYYENIRRHVDKDSRLHVNWFPITYRKEGGMLEKIPFIPTRISGTVRGMLQVREALRRSSADLIFYNTQVPAAIGGAIFRRYPYVLATDLTPIQYDAMATHYDHLADKKGISQKLKHLVNRQLYRSAELLLPWSQWTRNSLINDYGADPAKIKVLPPGVDLNIWHPAETRVSGPLRILFVGGDFARKGGRTTIDAFKMLAPGSAELHVVTKTALPEMLGMVVYNDITPNSPKLISLYQKCDVFVLPSEAEAFGIAAVEACATGLPVVATRTGGLNEIVEDGKTGFSLPARQPEELAKRLRILSENMELRAKMGRAARQRAELLYDAKVNAGRLVDYMIALWQERRILSASRIDAASQGNLRNKSR
jgi:glycosyltransferase involved in cell wall biosynthesis